MTKTNKMMLLLSNKRLFFSLLLGVMFLLGGIFFYNALLLIAFLLIFNFYDIVGYSILLENEAHYDINDVTDLKTPAYRVIQTMFQVILISFIFIMGDYSISLLIAIIVSHWLGGQDYLYYIVKQEKISDVLSWMEWTPIGIIKKDSFITKKEFVFQAYFGYICAVLIITLN